jgi:prefoldin subunit 5
VSIIFGSQEAKAVLEKDRALQRIEAEQSRRNTPEWIEERIEEIDAEIDDFTYQIVNLQMEQRELEKKLELLRGGA